MLGLAVMALAQSSPDKPALDPMYDWEKMESDFYTVLPAPSATKSYWPQGQVNEALLYVANQHGLNPSDFYCFDVQYTDCDKPWAFCRHNNAIATEDQLIQIFGLTPVGMRSYIRYVLIS